jgi:cytochrome c oxidase subunit III
MSTAMPRIVSDRAEKTDEVVVLPSTTEGPGKLPVGIYRIFLIALLGSIFAFFASLVFAYVYRAQSKQLWNPIVLPGILWVSTMLIALSSFTFEFARQMHRRGLWHVSSKFLLATAVLGSAFLASQLTAWRQLVLQGVFMQNNPHSSFFYLFTGLHGAHLIGGLAAIAYLMFGANKRRQLINAVCYYWHFLGVLWLGLFEVLRIVG